MRKVISFATTLMAVFGLALGAGAATLTMSADKATYAVGETIILTVLGDPQGALDLGIFGTIEYDGDLVSANDGQTQTALKLPDGTPWIRAGLNVDLPFANTQDSFSQLAGFFTGPMESTKKLTAVMTFQADAAGVASFSWKTTLGGQTQLDFFGLSDAPGTSVAIGSGTSGAVIPEPTAATLMCVGLLCLAIAGHRREP